VVREMVVVCTGGPHDTKDSSKTAVFCNSCLRIYGEMQKRFFKFVTFCVFEKIKKNFFWNVLLVKTSV